MKRFSLINRIAHQPDIFSPFTFRPLSADFPSLARTTWDLNNWTPAVDLKETQTAFELKADLPGFKKDQIEVNADGSTLFIKGNYDNTTTEDQDDNHYTKERIQASFQRSFSLPMNIPADKIVASLEDGVLKVNIPKPESTQKRIEIS
jgi:HSP20 family protein